LEDGVRRSFDARGRVHDLHETGHLILSQKFDAVLFSIGIKNVRKTPSREGCHALEIIITLRVPSEDVMKLLLDIDDRLTVSTKVLHDYKNYQRRVKREKEREIKAYQVIHFELESHKGVYNHKPRPKLFSFRFSHSHKFSCLFVFLYRLGASFEKIASN